MPDQHALPSVEAVLDSVPYSAVAIIDHEGTYRMIAGSLWAGLDVDPKRDLMGRTMRELWDPETAEALHANVDRSLRGEISEGLVPWEDRVYRVVTAPIASTADAAPTVLLFAQDVTEESRSEQLFRDVVQSVPVGVQATDGDGRMIVWNEQAAEIFGIPRDEALGRPGVEVLESLGVSRDHPFQQAIRSAAPWSGDVEIRRADGVVRLLQITRRAAGDRERGVSIAWDVTDLRRRTATEERELRLRSLGRLAGGVAHDFGNLLTAIVGRVDLIGERLAGSELQPELEELRAAVDTAERLTARLLSLGDRRTGEASCVPAKVFERLELLVRRVTPRNVAFAMHLDSRASVGLGSVELEQILLNLATNASDAMPAGGQVILSARDEGDEVVVRVRDQGSGIDPEVLPHIFDPFFSTKQVGKGVGIGLSTVQALVEAVGGTVEIESTGADGTTIALRLPRLERSDLAESEMEPAERDEEAIPNTAVLVVEDEDLVLGFIRRALETEGLEVVGVVDAEAARAVLVDRHDFGLILTDVSLPREDGFSLATWIVERFPRIPVVLMSGNFAMQIERHGPPPPAALTLEKPFGLKELRRIVREAVGAR